MSVTSFFLACFQEVFSPRCLNPDVAQCCWQQRQRISFSIFGDAFARVESVSFMSWPVRPALDNVKVFPAILGWRLLLQEEWFRWYFGVHPQDYTEKTSENLGLILFCRGCPGESKLSRMAISQVVTHPKMSSKLLSDSGRMWWKLGGSPRWHAWVTNGEIACAVLNLFFSGLWIEWSITIWTDRSREEQTWFIHIQVQGLLWTRFPKSRRVFLTTVDSK